MTSTDICMVMCKPYQIDLGYAEQITLARLDTARLTLVNIQPRKLSDAQFIEIKGLRILTTTPQPKVLRYLFDLLMNRSGMQKEYQTLSITGEWTWLFDKWAQYFRDVCNGNDAQQRCLQLLRTGQRGPIFVAEDEGSSSRMVTIAAMLFASWVCRKRFVAGGASNEGVDTMATRTFELVEAVRNDNGDAYFKDREPPALLRLPSLESELLVMRAVQELGESGNIDPTITATPTQVNFEEFETDFVTIARAYRDIIEQFEQLVIDGMLNQIERLQAMHDAVMHLRQSMARRRPQAIYNALGLGQQLALQRLEFRKHAEIRFEVIKQLSLMDPSSDGEPPTVFEGDAELQQLSQATRITLNQFERQVAQGLVRSVDQMDEGFRWSAAMDRYLDKGERFSSDQVKDLLDLLKEQIRLLMFSRDGLFLTGGNSILSLGHQDFHPDIGFYDEAGQSTVATFVSMATTFETTQAWFLFGDSKHDAPKIYAGDNDEFRRWGSKSILRICGKRGSPKIVLNAEH